MKMILLTGLILLVGCSNEASHLPSPLELPGAVLGTVVENATYGARRKRVKAFVQANYAALKTQAQTGQGAELERALDLAGVSGAKRIAAKQEFQTDYERYFLTGTSPNIEQIVVTLMVHGN